MHRLINAYAPVAAQTLAAAYAPVNITAGQFVNNDGTVRAFATGMTVQRKGVYLVEYDCEASDAMDGQVTVSNVAVLPANNGVMTMSPPMYAWGGGSRRGTALLAAWGNVASYTRIGVGQYQVTFAQPHPQGAAYVAMVSAEEDTNRDATDALIIEGTQNANGFRIMATTGDNGGTADAFVDERADFVVYAQGAAGGNRFAISQMVEAERGDVISVRVRSAGGASIVAASGQLRVTKVG